MANKLGSLVVSLGLDAAEFTRGMSKAEYQSFQSTEKIKGQMANLGKYIAGLSLGAAFVQSIRNTADYADEIGKLAQKAGTSATEVSKLAYAARQADVDNATLAKGLRALGEDALSGGKKLEELGIKTTDASGKAKGNAQLFREVADAIASMTDPQQKAAAAAELLGSKIGPELIPLLNQGAAGLKDMADEAERFGRVVTDDAAKAAEEFNDNLTKLNEAGAGLAAVIGNAVIPSVNALIQEFQAGIQSAGGFWSALSLATINPFRDASDNIKVLREDLKGLRGDRERYTKANSDTRAIDDAIKNAETKLNYLTTLENKAQAARVVYGADDQSKSEARRLGIIPPTRIPSAGKAPRSGSKAQGAASGKDPILEANQREADMLRLLGKIEDEETAKSLANAQRRRDATIEEFDAINRANTEYQSFVESLVDATPTAQLEKQRAAMQGLADEYERGRFGAVGSAEAVAAYGETVSTFLGTLGKEIETVNTTADQAGSIFGTWLERAITDGAKLSDVINGLIKDLIQLAIRKAVIEPAAAGVAGFAAQFFGASFDGGGYTGSGSRSGGVDGKGGFPAILHPNETVVDHTKGQGMGGVASIVQTFNIAGNADAVSVSQLKTVAKQIKAETLAAVQSNANRGGSFARSMGRA